MLLGGLYEINFKLLRTILDRKILYMQRAHKAITKCRKHFRE